MIWNHTDSSELKMKNLDDSSLSKYLDKIKNIVITADKAIYLKNKEKIFTIGNSKAVNNNNTITASSLNYDKIKNIFEAKKNVVVKDFERDTTIYADKITFLKNDEKFFTSVCDEVVPIFLNEPNSNKESILNFKPYKLQSMEFENESNPVMRWKMVLESNIKCLIDFEFGKSIYEKNIDIIRHNKSVLYDTDWKKLADNKIQELPSSIIDIVNNTNMKGALLYVY